MNISKYQNPNVMGDVFEVLVSREDTLMMGDAIFARAVELVAEQLAKDILENNYAEIMERISPQAIANMVIAEAGAVVNETLHKKLPDKILEIEKRTTEVYQKGLLGGLKRIQQKEVRP